MAELIIVGVLSTGIGGTLAGVFAGLRTTPGYPRTLKLLGGSAALATIGWLPNSFAVRNYAKEYNPEVARALTVFDEPLYGAPLAFGGVLAAGFGAGHSARAAHAAVKLALRGR